MTPSSLSVTWALYPNSTGLPSRPLVIGRASGSCRQGAVRVQGLDLGILVHAQDQGVLRGRHVEADDVADLADELRVRAQLPGLHDVRLEAEGLPDPRGRRLRQACLGG